MLAVFRAFILSVFLAITAYLRAFYLAHVQLYLAFSDILYIFRTHILYYRILWLLFRSGGAHCDLALADQVPCMAQVWWSPLASSTRGSGLVPLLELAAKEGGGGGGGGGVDMS